MSRNGPKKIITYSCEGCDWHTSENEYFMGDHGVSYYCTHAGEKLSLGRHSPAHPVAPYWCPVLMVEENDDE